MIDETNVDEHGRTKNTPLLYKSNQTEFETFCDIVYARAKMENNTQSIHVEAIHVLRSFREQKTRRKRKKEKYVVIFDLVECTRITTLFVKNSQNVVKSSMMDTLEQKTG